MKKISHLIAILSTALGISNATAQTPNIQTTGKIMTSETAILAGGCFWGMQDLIRERPGILSTRVGYTGGTTQNATYKDVSKGGTGHAESIEIIVSSNNFYTF